MAKKQDGFKPEEKRLGDVIHPCDYPEVPMGADEAMDRDWKLDHQIAKPIAGPIRSPGTTPEKRRTGSR